MVVGSAQPVVAVDVGGTFTDLIFWEGTGLKTVKVPTTPTAVEEGILRALELAGVTDCHLLHATTVATNAILTGNYPKVALLTTRGFRDVLEIGRQNRPEMYNLWFKKPPVLVPRERRVGIRERMSSTGEELAPLDELAVRQAAEGLAGEVEGFAISFLNSHVNPAHELRAREIVAGLLPQQSLTLSSEVDRQGKEYERTSTTVINAILKPVMARYLAKLGKKISKVDVMQSNGGFTTSAAAQSLPAAFIESGPAAGAIAVKSLCDKLGIPRAIGFDMGGTTAKASTVIDGKLSITNEYEVGGRTSMGRMIRGSGYPVRFAFVDLAEVSSGGGTIIWRDRGGALRVGPRSAEAVPGPACYGKGGKEPTLTDANLVLNRLPTELAGGLELVRALALETLESLSTGIKREAGSAKGGLPGAVEVALDAVSLATEEMARAIRIVTVERGLDPTEFTIVAYGGAGPLHVAGVMDSLGISKSIIPSYPGLFSALGLLLADYRHDFVLANTPGKENELFAELVSKGLETIKKEGDFEHIAVTKLADARYQGQSFELTVPYVDADSAKAEFKRLYLQKYGYTIENNPVEIVNLRLSITGLRKTGNKSNVKEMETPSGLLEAQRPRPFDVRRVWFESGELSAPIFERRNLRAGVTLDGPLVVQSFDSTVLVPPKFNLSVDRSLNLVLTH